MKAIGPGRSEDRTRLFYESRSQEYADATRSRALADVLEDFAGRMPAAASILDLGCGAGHDLASFRRRGHAAFGLDYAAPIAKIARATARSPVVVADMRAIPLLDATFDGVWASASLLHLPRSDLPVALREIKRVLKPGGLLFASVKTGIGDFRDPDGRFFTLYESANWREALMKSKFEAVATGFNASVPNGSTRSAEQWMTSLAVSS